MSHVYHLITAYVHRQSSSAQAQRIRRHVRICPECRAALDYERELVREMAATMPLVGRPPRGRLARLWPVIWKEFRAPRLHGREWLPSYSLALGLVILFVFAISALFAGTTQAIAAPFQLAPTEMKVTPTLTVTEQPANDTPPVSGTASVSTIPRISPVPLAGTGIAVSNGKYPVDRPANTR